MKCLLIPTTYEKGLTIPYHVSSPNPYAVARSYIDGWATQVKVDPKDQLFMFVDEEGDLKRLPINHAASMLAGRQIVGKAMIFQLELRHTDEGPDWFIADLDEYNERRLNEWLSTSPEDGLT